MEFQRQCGRNKRSPDGQVVVRELGAVLSPVPMPKMDETGLRDPLLSKDRVI